MTHLRSAPSCTVTELKFFCCLSEHGLSSAAENTSSSTGREARGHSLLQPRMPAHRSLLSPRWAFTHNAHLWFLQEVSVAALCSAVGFHFISLYSCKRFLGNQRSLHLTWVCLSARGCFKLLFAAILNESRGEKEAATTSALYPCLEVAASNYVPSL